MDAPAHPFARLTRSALGGLVALFLVFSPGCDPIRSSRVARGQLVTVGMSPYDDYFRKVHAEQIAGGTWADERKETRKPLVASLGLLPDSSGEVITAALKERAKSDGVAPLTSSIEAIARSELTRAEHVEARAPALEDLAKQGDDIRGRARHDFPLDSVKRRDTENELAASSHELRELADEARRHAREARRFVSGLSAATGVFYTGHMGGAQPSAPAPSASTPTPPPKKPAKPAPGPAPKPVDSKPAPKPGGEVFTP